MDVGVKLEKVKDIEISGKRDLNRGANSVVIGVGFLMTAFHLYVLLIRAIDPWIFRSIHIVFGGTLLFALVPGWKSAPKDRIHIVDYLFITGLLASVAYILWDLEDVIFRMGVDPNQWDILFSVIFVGIVLEMTRRTTGWALVITALVAILYGLLGQYSPGFLNHRGYGFARLFTYLFSLDGIMSVPIRASATYVFIFVLFGAFLERSGAATFFVDFARSIAGSRRGGPGKVSIVSSSMVGTVSGASVANVVIDGVFNIPLMKASGFKPSVAGAIEAMNSTAGQIVPPVMGTAAFIMAEILSISYSKVCIAAIIPSALYYVAAYLMIDFYSAKNNLLGVPKDQLPNFRGLMLMKGYLLIPLIVLVVCLMFFQMSPFRAVTWATFVLIFLSLFRTETRLGVRKIWQCFTIGPQSAIEIVSTCAAAGIIIGVISLTGLGLKFAMIIIEYSGGHLLLALLLTMIVSLILGMGLPTTAAYAVSASMLAPALITMNVPPLAAHLFVFYFAILSAVTPPVAVAAYAAAAISKSSAWEVAVLSVKFASAGFIIPFMFVYGQELIMIGSVPDIALALGSAILGVSLLSAAIQGWCIGLGIISVAERYLCLFGALILMKSGWISDTVGIGIALILYLYNSKKSQTDTTTSGESERLVRKTDAMN